MMVHRYGDKGSKTMRDVLLIAEIREETKNGKI